MKNININIIKLLIVFITLSSSLEVLAIDMDYYAPNGLPTIGDSFTRLALIFSDADYYFALPIIGALALIFSVINGYLVKPLTTGSNDRPVNIFAPLAIGTIIWVSGFMPTASLHIYDPVKNDTKSVAGIPQVIVLIAGLTNVLERNMIEITETGTANVYSKTAGGINLEMFINAQYKAHTNRKKFLALDIQSYYEDCGRVNMVITGNQNFEDLMTNTTSLYGMLGEWTHPSLFTNLYNGTPGKTNMSCTDAWNNVIKTQLVATNFDKDVEEVCAKSGFDVSKVLQLQQCKNTISDFAKIHDITTMPSSNYLRNAMIAHTILKKINLNDPTEAQQTLMRRQLVMQGLGALNSSEDTMPNIKAVMTAIILGIIPFLTLFLLTPLWSKALKFMTGSLLWLATWGVMIAVMHSATMDQAMTVLSDVAANKMGIDAFIFAQTDGVKALMFFGKMQSNSLMMATAIAIAVYGFGSYAMTGIAQGQAQNMQHMGENAAGQAHTAEGRAGVRDSQIGGVASEATVSNIPHEGMPSTKNWAEDTGSGAIAQGRMGDSARGVGAGQQTSLDANRAIGQFNESSKTGQAHSYQDFSEMTGTPLTNNATANAYAKTNRGQADASLLNDMQKVAGKGDSQTGAALFASSNGEQFAKLDKLRNMADLQGMDSNSPQDLMKINEDMANNNGNISMTGQQVFANNALSSKLNDDQLSDINNNWNTPMAVRPSFNPDGSVKDAQIGIHTDTSFTQNASDQENTLNENKRTVDSSNIKRDDNINSADNIDSSVTRVDSGTRIDTSSHFDGATMLSAMQNGYKDENYPAIEKRFNEAKNVATDPTDDNKAARFNLLKDTLYGFADVTNREETSDERGLSNRTGLRGSIGGNMPFTKIGGEAYSDSEHNASTRETESHSIDATWGKLNEIYEQSGTAHEFLTEANKFHDTQHETMTNMSKEGDLSQDNPTNQEQKQQQQEQKLEREKSVKEDEQRVRDYLATKGGSWY